VFLSGLGLTTIQAFTNRTADLRRAIDRVAMTASNNLSPEAERTRTPVRTQGLDQATPVTAGAEYTSGAVSIAEREARLNGGGGADPSEALLTRIELRMEEGYSRFLAEYEGDSSLSGLRAAVTGLALLPGRKSILYFTEELPITSRLKARFDALIGEANRANIAIYPVDAAGLRVHSKEAETARGVNLAGAQGVGDASRGDGAYTKDLEKQSEALSSRPVAALGRLANETGGFVIDNTNDLAKGVARMQIERTTYYLLGYQPNTALDGKFHRVTVKVKRGKVSVRARPGYVALCCPPR
jgi:VWFA-related protein